MKDEKTRQDAMAYKRAKPGHFEWAAAMGLLLTPGICWAHDVIPLEIFYTPISILATLIAGLMWAVRGKGIWKFGRLVFTAYLAVLVGLAGFWLPVWLENLIDVRVSLTLVNAALIALVAFGFIKYGRILVR